MAPQLPVAGDGELDGSVDAARLENRRLARRRPRERGGGGGGVAAHDEVGRVDAEPQRLDGVAGVDEGGGEGAVGAEVGDRRGGVAEGDGVGRARQLEDGAEESRLLESVVRRRRRQQVGDARNRLAPLQRRHAELRAVPEELAEQRAPGCVGECRNRRAVRVVRQVGERADRLPAVLGVARRDHRDQRRQVRRRVEARLRRRRTFRLGRLRASQRARPRLHHRRRQRLALKITPPCQDRVQRRRRPGRRKVRERLLVDVRDLRRRHVHGAVRGEGGGEGHRIACVRLRASRLLP